MGGPRKGFGEWKAAAMRQATPSSGRCRGWYPTRKLCAARLCAVLRRGGGAPGRHLPWGDAAHVVRASLRADFHAPSGAQSRKTAGRQAALSAIRARVRQPRYNPQAAVDRRLDQHVRACHGIGRRHRRALHGAGVRGDTSAAARRGTTSIAGRIRVPARGAQRTPGRRSAISSSSPSSRGCGRDRPSTSTGRAPGAVGSARRRRQ